MIIYRGLDKEELQKFLSIDRQEVIEEIYYLKEGKLVLENESYDMKGFPPGEQEDILQRLYKLKEEDGVVIGAFEGAQLVGITSLENKLRGSRRDQMKMDILFVDYGYRRKGIAKKLVEILKNEALKKGAKKIYISATPSKNTVDFYMGIGCSLAEEVDQELFQLEPLDIHLELPL